MRGSASTCFSVTDRRRANGCPGGTPATIGRLRSGVPSRDPASISGEEWSWRVTRTSGATPELLLEVVHLPLERRLRDVQAGRRA